jgi:hypothetical protein
MAMSAESASGSANKVAARATIGFNFMYSAFFAIFFNYTMWIPASELIPVFLCAKGMILSTLTLGVSSIVVPQVTPVALQNIGWRFYGPFIAITALSIPIYAFVLPETKGKSLEEIGELFGDVAVRDKGIEVDSIKHDD